MPTVKILIKPGSIVYGVKPNCWPHKVREYKVLSVEVREFDQIYHCLETGEPNPTLDLYEMFSSEFQKVMHENREDAETDLVPWIEKDIQNHWRTQDGELIAQCQ